MKYSINKKPSDYLAELALKHKLRRKEMGLSQAEMAEKSGVSLGSLKRFETTGLISLDSLLKLLDVLGRLNDLGILLEKKESIDDAEKLFRSKMHKE